MKTLAFIIISLGLILLPGLPLRANAPCDPSFTYQAITNTQFHFVSNQTNQVHYTYYHTWNFNNHGSAYTPVTDYNFYQPGVYQVCHTITIQDSTGSTLCTDSQCLVIQIAPPPPPCFPAFYVTYHNSGPMTELFTNTLANYTNVAISWNFGDGTTLAGVASPTHQYPAYGYYTACFYATDTIRNCSDTSCISIHVDSAVTSCNLYAGFYYRQPLFNSTAINLTAQTSGNYQLIHWDFGDSTTSGSLDTVHQFPAFGMYNVCLTLTDTTTGCSASSCEHIWVDTCNNAMAQFSYYTGTNGLNISFEPTYNFGYHPNLMWLWNFGDSSINNTNFYTNHNYPSFGTYICCFDVGVPGCGYITSCDTVSVQCHLSANFASTQISSNAIAYTPYISYNSAHLTYQWIFGDNTSGSEAFPIHIFPQGGNYNTCLMLTDTVLHCSDTICNQVVVYQWTDTICGNVWIDANLNGIQDSLEQPVIGATIDCYYQGDVLHFTTDSSGNYWGIVPIQHNLLISLNYPGTLLYTLPFINSGNTFYPYIFSNASFRQCGFDFGILSSCAMVSGKVYADLNHNGIADVGEQGITNQLVDIGSQSVITTTGGNYRAVVPMGSFILSKDASGFFSNFAVNPVQIPLNVSVPGNLYSQNNFGIQIDSNYHDVAIDLIPISPVNPASNPLYELLLSNLSPNPANTQSNIVSDSDLHYVYGMQTPSSNDTATFTTTWQNNIPPFGQSLIDLVYSTSPSVVINQNIYNTANIQLLNGPDQDTSNNIDFIHQIAVASFDPNYKEANNTGTGPQGYISADQELKYIIHFQNTGTAPAINIIVKDVLDQNFDLKSFRFVGTTAVPFFGLNDTCDVRLEGNTIYFRFSEIMLPYASQNALLSSTGVVFAIKPKHGLAPGTQLLNNAAIYFDHNDPVYTNTTLHTIESPESVSNIYDDGNLLIAPNPFGEQTIIRLSNMPGANYRYTITDIIGKQISEGYIKNDTPVTLYRNHMSAGAYLITFYNDKGLVKRAKIIAE